MDKQEAKYVTMGVWPSSKKQFLQNALDREMSLVEYFDWLVKDDAEEIKIESSSPDFLCDCNFEPIQADECTKCGLIRT